jgi:hypothetical protein
MLAYTTSSAVTGLSLLNEFEIPYAGTIPMVSLTPTGYMVYEIIPAKGGTIGVRAHGNFAPSIYFATSTGGYVETSASGFITEFGETGYSLELVTSTPGVPYYAYLVGEDGENGRASGTCYVDFYGTAMSLDASPRATSLLSYYTYVAELTAEFDAVVRSIASPYVQFVSIANSLGKFTQYARLELKDQLDSIYGSGVYSPGGITGSGSETVYVGELPVQRIVHIYHQVTGELLGSAISDASGAVSFSGLAPGTYYVTAVDFGTMDPVSKLITIA